MDRWTGEHATLARFLSAAALVVAATGVCLLLRPLLQTGSLVLPYLIAIVLAAVAHGLLPSLFACVLSVLAFDYLFLLPYYSLTISDPDDLTQLVIFALTALIVSNLAAYARRQAVTASLRAEIAEELYHFGRQLAAAGTVREVLDAAQPHLWAMLGATVHIVLPAGGGPTADRERLPRDTVAGRAIAGTEFAKIKSWLLQEARVGPDTRLPESASWVLVPMRTARGKAGVLAIAHDDLNHVPVPNSDALFGTLADLLAQAIDRINLVDDLNEASRAAEREELHAALLASLSHDLRTPLASALGSTESLIAQGETIGPEQRQHLALSIQDDARRLNRYIGNLLDMTRLEAGLTDTTSDRIDLADVVSVALHRCADTLRGHPDRGGAGTGSAVSRRRRGPTRASVVQPVGQCREIQSARFAGRTARRACFRRGHDRGHR